MKILSIGNSFSEDAHTYLYKLATANGADVETLNLYIGGCPLTRHADNVKTGAPAYAPQHNGCFLGGAMIGVRPALLMRKWDIVTIQQVSGDSGLYETYQPSLNEVAACIRELCPTAKIMIHETWAYETGSTHSKFPSYDCDRRKMHEALAAAYKSAMTDISADGIIPVGDVIAALREAPDFSVELGGISLCRDGHHLSYDYGRYAAAATWYQYLGLGDIEQSTYLPTPECDPEKIALINKTVKETVK